MTAATAPAGLNQAGPDLDVSARQLSDELADKGFLLTTTDDLINWARTGSLMWMTFGFGVLRRRNDADGDAALRSRALRRRPAREPAAI